LLQRSQLHSLASIMLLLSKHFLLLCCHLLLYAGTSAQGAPPAVSPADLLSLCAATSVRQAEGPGAVSESLKAATAICGYSSPAALLPLLLQPPQLLNRSSRHKPAKASAALTALEAAADPAAVAAWGGAGRRNAAAALLQPASQLLERAAAVMQVQGISKDDLAKLLRWSPASVLHRDPKTTHLKLVLLQRQLLGWEPAHSSARTESVAPEMTKMLKRCPWVSGAGL
jgi:cytochrome P450